MGDTPIRISQLNPGDKVSATIITAGKPEILTAQAVDAQLAATPPPPAPAAAPAPAPEPAEETAVESPAAAPAAPAAEPQALEPEPAPVEPAPLPKPYTKNPFFWLIVAIIILALIWVLIRRRVKKDEPK